MSSAECRIERFRVSQLRIPFKVLFRHAAAERAETSSVWVEALAEDGTIGFGESCPRPYVTGETVDTACEFIVSHEAALRHEITDLDSLRRWLDAHQTDVDANPAAWCAVELALLDLFAKRQGVPLERLLSLKPLAGSFHYTAVLGDAPDRAFQAQVERYWTQGFRDYKVKLSGNPERDRMKMHVFELVSRESSSRVRVDANNLWSSPDDALAALRDLPVSLFAVEEPIGHNRHAELPHIARGLACCIILDESFARRDQLSLLEAPASQWIINVRVSKMGGLLRSLRVVSDARAQGIKVIVGAQVGETSLLTRAGLAVAHAAGDALAAQEGAFGTHLLERDVCNPPLMFGPGGVLEVSAHPMLAKPGFGMPAPLSAPGSP